MTPEEFRKLCDDKMSESDHQKRLVKQLTAEGYLFNSTPNGMHIKEKDPKKRGRYINSMKAEGLQPGFPDLTVHLPKKVLYIELKRTKNSKTSDDQREWIAELNRLSYAEARVCKGWREAMEFVHEFDEKPKENPNQKHIGDYL